jgi:hypothetical protein
MIFERDCAINAKVSAQAALRLRQLSNRQGRSYGEVLTDLLLSVPVESADWEAPLAAMQARIEALETRLAGMQQGTPQEAVESPFEAQPMAEQPLDANVAVNASTGVEDAEIEPGSEPEEPSFPILPKILIQPAKPVHEFVANLIAGGERSPSQIAKALNKAGYRTGTGSEYIRSSTVITNPLKELRG